jgi:hypothetical protein
MARAEHLAGAAGAAAEIEHGGRRRGRIDEPRDPRLGRLLAAVIVRDGGAQELAQVAPRQAQATVHRR